MDSEESRGDVSSEGEGEGDASDVSGSGSNPPRLSNPRSADGPESPDNCRSQSYRSDGSTVDSPDNFRPPSPDYRPKDSDGKAQSPAESNPNPSSPNRSDSAPASPRPDSPTEDSNSYVEKPQNESSDKKWSPKSDEGNTRSPEGGRRFGNVRSSPKKMRSRSVSSSSSHSSSRRARTSRSNNPPTEEISEGEMDFDHEEKREKTNDTKSTKRDKKNVDMEDLSDVSDLESSGPISEDDGRLTARKNAARKSETAGNHESTKDLNATPKVNGEKYESNVTTTIKPSSNVEPMRYDKNTQDKSHKTDDVEEQLDFEAEEGECLDAPPTSRLNSVDKKSDTQNDSQKKDDEGSGEASSLEEGEVTDDEERRPEETEPRPVCRFYSRGQCTWGVSCRFLHPGVTDKGNYTMFDMVRSMPPSGYSQHPGHLHPQMPPAGLQHHSSLSLAARLEPPVTESAWERGLRTAKEMMRKACKRKEQDSDFEEKKMHLSLGGAGGRGASLGPGEEEDPDLAAYAGFPPPSSPVIKREKEEYFRLADRRYEEVGRGYGPRDRGYERTRGSKSPPHRGGLGSNAYDDKMDDRALQKSRRARTTREVIVQRAPGGLGSGRGDEWADPWMRGGGGGGGGGNRSPGARRGREKPRRRRRGYSSGSSYSSSSSSRSSSRSSNSSVRSGSLGRKRSRRRPHSPGKHRRGALSPSVIVQEKRAATARAQAMNPPAPSSRKRVPSPAAIRQNAANPPPPPPVTKNIIDEFGRTKPVKVRQRKMYSKSSTSGSDSSSSSSDSDSDSHSSSSSDSSKGRNKPPQRGVSGGLDKKPAAKISSGTRLLSPKYITDAQKKEAAENSRKDTINSKKRPASSPIKDSIPPKKPVSRREELLKQLKAVEEAIARKRSKI